MVKNVSYWFGDVKHIALIYGGTMTIEEIKQDMGDDKYLNSFKARRYIEFLLAEVERLESKIAILGNIFGREL